MSNQFIDMEKNMNKYDFALIFKLADEIDSEIYLDAIYEAGCNDASVCMGKIGWMELDFIRCSHSASEAIESAIADVNRAVPNAVLKHISPDIVGITEIATIMNCSRQYVRQMINSNSYT
ncbi:MAG: DNA-binding protein, partial [Xenococcus sp. (in: cyanobacteria)]